MDQTSFCVWAQQMRNDVTLQRRFSLAEPIFRVIPVDHIFNSPTKSHILPSRTIYLWVIVMGILETRPCCTVLWIRNRLWESIKIWPCLQTLQTESRDDDNLSSPAGPHIVNLRCRQWRHCSIVTNLCFQLMMYTYRRRACWWHWLGFGCIHSVVPCTGWLPHSDIFATYYDAEWSWDRLCFSTSQTLPRYWQ